MQNSMNHGPKLPDNFLPQDVLYADVADRDAPDVYEDPLAPIKSRRRRALARRRRLWVWTQTLGFAVASLLLMGGMFKVHSEYREWQMRVEKREEELAALKTQLAVGQKRLTALQSPQGREQVLVEHGYLRSGDRLLQFPPDAEESRQATLPPNDLTPHPVANNAPSSDSPNVSTP
jgi:hypothetical protein